MANTRIALKRSATNATIPALFQGELVYSQNGTGQSTTNSGLLYIGQPSDNAARIIGGTYAFGVLTANQAIVTNATSYIDKILVANMVAINAEISGTLKANGALGVSGNVLISNATGGVYWGTVSAGSVTLTIGNGIICTQSPFTTAGTISANIDGSLKFTSGAVGVNAAATSGLVANATGLWVLVGNGHTVNATGYIAVNSSSSIAVTATGPTVNLASSPGLITTSGLAVSPGPSIAVGATTTVNLASSPGLVIASGLAVSPGSTIAVGATTTVNLASTPGLIGTSGLSINLASTPGMNLSSGLTVYAGPTLTLNSIGVHVNNTLSITDLTCAGNLTVSGTLTSINATDLLIKDNMIQLAANQSGQAGTFLTGDAVDSGLYFQIGNSSANACYSGFSRLKNALGSSNTQPYFKIWAGNTAPSATSVTASNTGYLESFLVPWGAGGLFVCNGTNISLSSNSTVALAIAGGATTTIAAGTLQLTTALPVSNIAAGSDGTVLTSATGTGVAWTGLDGGTFNSQYRIRTIAYSRMMNEDNDIIENIRGTI